MQSLYLCPVWKIRHDAVILVPYAISIVQKLRRSVFIVLSYIVSYGCNQFLFIKNTTAEPRRVTSPKRNKLCFCRNCQNWASSKIVVFRDVCFCFAKNVFPQNFQLEQKQVPPPYRPRLESERDLANFPPEFTDEPVQLTPDDA